jgi:O-antigen/teichoic acid export membrane protein
MSDREPPEADPVEEGAPALIATTGVSVLRGGLWKVASSALPQLYTLVVSIVAARVLGPSGLGRQSFIAFIELSTIALLSGGLATALMRYVAERTGAGNPAIVAGLFAWAWRLACGTAAVGWLALTVIALAGGEPTGAWVLAGFVCLASILSTIPSAVLIGLQRWREATIAGLVVGAVATPLTVTVLLVGGGITGMFAMETIAAFAGLLWTAYLARRATGTIAPKPLAADPGLRRAVIRFALVSSLGVILELVVWRRSEFLFLAYYATDDQIAYYSIAFALVNAIIRLPSTAASVVTPAVAHLHGAGAHERIRSGLATATRLAALITLPTVALTLALGPETVSVVWGEDFDPARHALLVLAASSLLVPFSVLGASVLVGIGRIRLLVGFGFVAAVVDVTLAILLVPRHGALGAAFANAGAQIVSGGLAFGYALHVVEWPRVGYGRIVRVALAAAAAGATAWATQYLVTAIPGIVVGLVGGGIVFLAFGAALRIVDPRDAQVLTEAAGSRLRRPVAWLVSLLGASPPS